MPDSIYRLDAPYARTVRVYYPLERGRISLRTELNWELDVPPSSVDPKGTYSEFIIETNRPFVYVQPCLRTADTVCSAAAHSLVFITGEGTRDLYPYFNDRETGTILAPIQFDSTILGREHCLRVYLPPGYYENPFRRYPVLYMQDGKNLFFPEEAFLGRDWHVNERVATLDRMNAVEQIIVVGIYSAERMTEYTAPGYYEYGRSIVKEVKPLIDRTFRTEPHARSTCVMGSSLGGVVSFFMAWEWPRVFANAACLSSTFSMRDDLMYRVATEPKRKVRLYIDSGWPGDNYEVGLAMAITLVDRGYEYGRDFIHYSFPMAEHAEPAWSERLHLPLEFFVGLPARASLRKRLRKPKPPS